MPGFAEIFREFLAPALIVLAALSAAWFVPRFLKWPRDGRWLGAVAVSAGFAVAERAISGTPSGPPAQWDVKFWLFWFTIPIAFLGLLDGLLLPPNWVRAGILFVVARLGVRVLLAPLIRNAGVDAAATLWSLETWADGVAAVTVLWWLVLEFQAEKMHRMASLGTLFLVTAGATALFALSNNVTAAQSAAALTAMTAAIIVLAIVTRNLSAARGVVVALVVPLIARWIIVHFYSYTEPPPAAIVLFLIAPLLTWTADLPRLNRIRRGRVLLQLLPVLLAIAIAALLTARQPPPSHPGTDDSSVDY